MQWYGLCCLVMFNGSFEFSHIVFVILRVFSSHSIQVLYYIGYCIATNGWVVNIITVVFLILFLFSSTINHSFVARYSSPWSTTTALYPQAPATNIRVSEVVWFPIVCSVPVTIRKWILEWTSSEEIFGNGFFKGVNWYINIYGKSLLMYWYELAVWKYSNRCQVKTILVVMELYTNKLQFTSCSCITVWINLCWEFAVTVEELNMCFWQTEAHYRNNQSGDTTLCIKLIPLDHAIPLENAVEGHWEFNLSNIFLTIHYGIVKDIGNAFHPLVYVL